MRKFLEEEMNHKIIFDSDNVAYGFIIKNAFNDNADCVYKGIELYYAYNDPMKIEKEVSEEYNPIEELAYKYTDKNIHAQLKNGICIYRDSKSEKIIDSDIETKYSLEVNIDKNHIDSKAHMIRKAEPGHITLDVFTYIDHNDTMHIDKTISSEITGNEEYEMVSILFLNGYNIPIVRTYPGTKEAEEFAIENIDKLFLDKSLSIVYDDTSWHELVSEQKVFIDCQIDKFAQDTDFTGMVNENGIKILYGNQGQDIENFHVELNESGDFVTAYYQRLKSDLKAPDKICGLSKDTLDLLRTLTIPDFKMPELPNITYQLEGVNILGTHADRCTITYMDRSGIKFKYFTGIEPDTFLYADPYCTTVFKISGNKIDPIEYYAQNMEQTRIWLRDIQGIPVFYHNPNIYSADSIKSGEDYIE